MLIPRREIDFHLYDVLSAAALCDEPRYAAHDRQVFDAILDAAERIAADCFAPHAAACDRDEPALRDGRVWLLPETREALDAYNAAGFGAATFDRADGGMQLPELVGQAAGAMFAGANVAFLSYAMLTAGAARLIASFGSPAQRARYVAPMLEGRFFGTMCLSEPQAGSSLADVRTLATPQPDGGWRMNGSKMWISGGEHELAENIVHLVLARTPDAPPGVRGISLFAVPRRRIDGDGRCGADNDVRLVGLNHKMGWRGTVNTALSFGERGECTAELVGEEGHGLPQMFQMMNAARISVGMNAVALGYSGYLHALAYARERPQGRPLSARVPASPPVPILRHGDVRRMLLAQKAWVEGGLALVLYSARLADEIACAGDDDAARAARGLLELLTPVAKSWPAEYCLEANKLAIQVHGGYGYTRDYPVERLYRDNRLNHIHEGTWGIHGLDLLGRKAAMDGGAALSELAARITATVQRAAADQSLAEQARALAAALDELRRTTGTLLAAAADDPERGLLYATPYLDATGHVIVAWRWLEQALAARALQAAGRGGPDFLAGKLAACRYFCRCELPRAVATFAQLRALDDTPLAIPDAGF